MSAALRELDRSARVATGTTESLVGAGSTVQEVVTDPAQKSVPSSLAEDTIWAFESSKIVTASPAIYAVATLAPTDPVIATACADDVLPASASHKVVSGAGDDDVSMVRADDLI